MALKYAACEALRFSRSYVYALRPNVYKTNNISIRYLSNGQSIKNGFSWRIQPYRLHNYTTWRLFYPIPNINRFKNTFLNRIMNTIVSKIGGFWSRQTMRMILPHRINYRGGGSRVRFERPVVQSHFENARKIFANSILSRVTTNVSSTLREKTTKQLLYGNSTPFFAFVGLGLASGSVLNKEDQLEGLAWEIRESSKKMQDSIAAAESDLFQPNEKIGIDRFTIGPYIGKGSNAAIFAARKILDGKTGPEFVPEEELKGFPFVLKMVFNFGIESNAFDIMNKTYREMVPARICYSPETQDFPEIMHLPPHPNLVTMHLAFPDWVPENLPGTSEFLNALPSRLSSAGFGRNMSLFILMKRYEMNLSEYLSKGKLETREAILIFAQILEAVAHINRNGVAHRDIKCDNFLLDTIQDETPNIVLSDFGCCLADPINGLFLPLLSSYVDKGGNAALMAPEVATAKPSNSILNRRYIDYSKSDAWAAGAIAYELFNGINPFLTTLKNNTYNESDLPDVDAPYLINKVIKSLLIKNPSKRITADMAADIVNLYLWAPSYWFKQANPSNSEIIQWLLCITTKILTTARFGHRRSQVEYLLIGSFLRRIDLSRLRSAISFAQD